MDGGVHLITHRFPSQPAQYIIDRDLHSADAGLATALAWLDSDVMLIIHHNPEWQMGLDYVGFGLVVAVLLPQLCFLSTASSCFLSLWLSCFLSVLPLFVVAVLLPLLLLPLAVEFALLYVVLSFSTGRQVDC